MIAQSKPNPGSDAAAAQGCTCPRISNAYGRGAQGTSGDAAVFWYSDDCPVHVKEDTRHD